MIIYSTCMTYILHVVDTGCHHRYTTCLVRVVACQTCNTAEHVDSCQTYCHLLRFGICFRLGGFDCSVGFLRRTFASTETKSKHLLGRATNPAGQRGMRRWPGTARASGCRSPIRALEGNRIPSLQWAHAQYCGDGTLANFSTLESSSNIFSDRKLASNIFWPIGLTWFYVGHELVPVSDQHVLPVGTWNRRNRRVKHSIVRWGDFSIIAKAIIYSNFQNNWANNQNVDNKILLNSSTNLLRWACVG